MNHVYSEPEDVKNVTAKACEKSISPTLVKRKEAGVQ